MLFDKIRPHYNDFRYVRNIDFKNGYIGTEINGTAAQFFHFLVNRNPRFLQPAVKYLKTAVMAVLISAEFGKHWDGGKTKAKSQLLLYMQEKTIKQSSCRGSGRFPRQMELFGFFPSKKIFCLPR